MCHDTLNPIAHNGATSLEKFVYSASSRAHGRHALASLVPLALSGLAVGGLARQRARPTTATITAVWIVRVETNLTGEVLLQGSEDVWRPCVLV